MHDREAIVGADEHRGDADAVGLAVAAHLDGDEAGHLGRTGDATRHDGVLADGHAAHPLVATQRIEQYLRVAVLGELLDARARRRAGLHDRGRGVVQHHHRRCLRLARGEVRDGHAVGRLRAIRGGSRTDTGERCRSQHAAAEGEYWDSSLEVHLQGLLVLYSGVVARLVPGGLPGRLRGP